jgi:leucyl aminopeptidase
MGGAAAVIATVVLAAKQQLPIDVIATVPMAENMPSSDRAAARRRADAIRRYHGRGAQYRRRGQADPGRRDRAGL